MKTSTTYLAMWLLATLVAVLLSLNMLTAALVDGSYIPVGNDSFYHARRILDAAIGERGFYQFDDMIHVPEGSWLSWPWAYDYLVAAALSVALLVSPGLEPMAFIAYVPVFWILINAGLLTLIAWQMRLGPVYAGLVLLGFALSPLTQTTHGVGVIDHHFIELTFVLATVFTGLRFFSAQRRTADVYLLGGVLGIAPAFHNGLFILQVPVLACFFFCWLRAEYPDQKSALRFAGTLLVSTLAIVLPSGPFRDMQFEFWTLSWFHFYIAASSAVCVSYLALQQFSSRSLQVFLGLGALLTIPLFTKILTGAAFLSGELGIIQEVLEVQSPFSRLFGPAGLLWITTYYSWLFFLAPVIAILFCMRGWHARDNKNRFFAVFVVFGVLMMLAQFRFHPFGYWTLLIGPLLLLQDFAERHRLTAIAAFGIPIVVFALAFQPPVKNRLFMRYPPGNTVDYAATRSLYPGLATECAKDQGIAISYNDDGHYIRYHTDCSVISNNFLISPQHEEKVVELDRLLQMDPEQLLEQAPHIEYIFARLYQIFGADEEGRVTPTPVPQIVRTNAPLFVALMFADELPKEYVLLGEVRVEDERDFPFGRVYKIVRD